MAYVETPRSPSVQSFASADTVSISFSSMPGSPAMSPVSDDAAARATHEATDVPAQSHRFYLDVRSLKLKLDDGTFYHVHRHFFERHAPRFAEQYLCGETPDIIEVHDVSSVDFQRFLSIIYPRRVLTSCHDLGVCDIHTVDEWTSVLRLASKWFVTSLRDVAVREIETLRPTPIATILIAREFGLGEAWLVPAFVALCKSLEPLGFEDAERLGLRTAIEIARAAVRASNVLLSPGANGVGPRRASVSSLTPPPDSAPVPTGLAAPMLSNEPGLASVLDPSRSSPPQSPLPRLNDDLAYLALLSAERAEERLFTGGYHGYHGHYFALRIAHRLVTETSNAAIRHRYWRRMWLKLGGSSVEALEGCRDASCLRVYAIINHAPVEKRKRGTHKGITRPPSVQSFASNESISLTPSTTSTASTASTAPAMTPSKGDPRFSLSDGNIKFKLDDGSVYNVHRSFFEVHSPKFAAEFLCNSHAEVVRLPEISSVDFECFLSMIYPTAIGEFDVHTVAEWTSVLRLATKWSFDRLRALALREVEAIATAVDKIVLAREFDFGDAWIEPALKALCAAPGWLEYEEAERLGLHTVFEIGRARERLRKTAVSIPDKLEAKKAGSVKVKTSVATTFEHPVLPCPRPTVPITPKECADPSTKPLSKLTWARSSIISAKSPPGWGIGPGAVFPPKDEKPPEKPEDEVKQA
ncbi:hypothetical protein EV715DRAFT_212649 [Schizophyllum commune]